MIEANLGKDATPLRVGGEGPQTLEQKGSSLRLAVVELAFKHAVNERNGSFAEEQAFRGTADGYSATVAHIDAWETALFVQLPIAKDVEGPWARGGLLIESYTPNGNQFYLDVATVTRARYNGSLTVMRLSPDETKSALGNVEEAIQAANEVSRFKRVTSGLGYSTMLGMSRVFRASYANKLEIPVNFNPYKT